MCWISFKVGCRMMSMLPCSFQGLRDLMPSQEKTDKASFLMAAVEYIRKLQVRAALRMHCTHRTLPVQPMAH